MPVMIQVTYTSVAADNLDSGEVFRIVETSASNNAAADLTGFLLFSEGRFFQVVEGPEECIDALMARLDLDPRHHSIKVSHRVETASRSFAKWRMKRVALPSRVARLSDLSPEFNEAPDYIKRCVEDFLRLERAG